MHTNCIRCRNFPWDMYKAACIDEHCLLFTQSSGQTNFQLLSEAPWKLLENYVSFTLYRYGEVWPRYAVNKLLSLKTMHKFEIFIKIARKLLRNKQKQTISEMFYNFVKKNKQKPRYTNRRNEAKHNLALVCDDDAVVSVDGRTVGLTEWYRKYPRN